MGVQRLEIVSALRERIAMLNKEIKELEAKKHISAEWKRQQIAKRKAIINNCLNTVKTQTAYIKRVSQPRNR